MAIIAQQNLFGWEEIENLGDLERLKCVIETLPDETLMQKLERERGRGRNDHPVRAIWNALLAGIVFQHQSIESLRRELNRNGQLRHLCGLGIGKVPSAAAFTRFLKNIIKHTAELDKLFNALVLELSKVLPDFGKRLAIDSKAIASFAKRKSTKLTADGRRDTDAEYSKKIYQGVHKDGTPWKKEVKWFGYKVHLAVDADYELPVACLVTKANTADAPLGHELVDHLAKRQPELIKNTEILTADRAYDDEKFLVKLYDEHRIKPVIDIRNMWKDGEKTRLFLDETNLGYDYKGTIYCYCPETSVERTMANGGFEKDRETLKKVCPAKQYGIECKGKDKCPLVQGIRIPLKIDRRKYTPIDRSSYKWAKEYKKRTSVERVNSRLDVSFGFENHTIRGLEKMKAKCMLALCTMLAMALGRINEKQMEKMRSLVRCA